MYILHSSFILHYVHKWQEKNGTMLVWYGRERSLLKVQYVPVYFVLWFLPNCELCWQINMCSNISSLNNFWVNNIFSAPPEIMNYYEESKYCRCDGRKFVCKPLADHFTKLYETTGGPNSYWVFNMVVMGLTLYFYAVFLIKLPCSSCCLFCKIQLTGISVSWGLYKTGKAAWRS